VRKIIGLSILLIPLATVQGVPTIHPNIFEENGTLSIVIGENHYPLRPVTTKYSLSQLVGNPTGTVLGLRFDFGQLNGKLYYGFIHPQDSRHPQPVFYKKFSVIEQGQADINILFNLSGKYDMVNWQKQGQGTLGYRVVGEDGSILYDGKVAFLGHVFFRVNPASIVEGPFVHFATDGTYHDTVRISFDTLKETTATITVRHSSQDNQIYTATAATHHELTLHNLMPNTIYAYTVETRKKEAVYTENYTFTTAPTIGSRKPFIFAYASDSRAGQGGGERNLEGTNAYMMKKIMALTSMKQAAFMVFTGDLIDGYSNSIEYTQVQYRNWKRAVEPFAHYLPLIVGMGNHEAVTHVFDSGLPYGISIDRFPYATESAEAVFASQFVNPTNGLLSEDGANYDPDPQQQDFPSYQENVFYCVYDNVAIVTLNSNYWYTPAWSEAYNGNLHGYLMNNQLVWLKDTLNRLDTNEAIDFVFVTQHTPAFPNGGHVGDDMWYHGNNDYRAVVKHTVDGENLITHGIIEQRDKFLTVLMQSKKVVAMLTGDEHNLNRLLLTKAVNIYPEQWDKPDIREMDFFRPLWQVNNGAAGAPYYAQEETPWSKHVQGFSTQNAVVFFHVDGKQLQMEAVNPDTLETVWALRELAF
jgi:hypothetical protein